jgi:hypothetical protein
MPNLVTRQALAMAGLLGGAGNKKHERQGDIRATSGVDNGAG